MSAMIDRVAVKYYLQGLQERICQSLEVLDGQSTFGRDEWSRPEGGGGLTRILAEGGVFEKAGVGFSHVMGTSLPPSATAHRPELAGRRWEAMGVSLVIHPRNPYVPTSHANVRFFIADADQGDPIWWFGGGFDLTPYYGFRDDVVHWHRVARDCLNPLDPALYPRFKDTCDRYFFLKHRGEARGVGGLFFDDFSEGGFAHAFAVQRAVGDAFIPAYTPIVERRQNHPFGERERDFQLYRRGRYVEFNLVWDRGTLFGLQSGGRTESILMSLPPLVRWDYQRQFEPESPEARLKEDFLDPRDWLADVSKD